jgi:transcriptional regulator with XRE-family HTH domain
MPDAAGPKKRKITQEDLARHCKLDQGSVSRILNKDTRDSFADETVDLVFRAARELGYLHPALVSSNRRASDRKKAGFSAKISIVIGMNTNFDEGTCDVEEVSSSGMMLKCFRTKKHAFPMDRFRIDIEMTAPPKLKGFRCRGKVVRFADDPVEFGIAVRFENLDEQSRETLRAFLK